MAWQKRRAPLPRPVVTKGDVQRVVAGAIAGGLQPGTFSVHVEGGRITVHPCEPVRYSPPSRTRSKLDALLDDGR